MALYRCNVIDPSRNYDQCGQPATQALVDAHSKVSRRFCPLHTVRFWEWPWMVDVMIPSPPPVLQVDEIQTGTVLDVCNLTLDRGAIEVLHDFAKRLGLKRELYRHQHEPHYVLSCTQAATALLLGAKYVPARARMEWG